MALTRRQSVTIARKRRPLRRRICADWGKTEHGSNGVGKGAWAAVQVAPHGDAPLPPLQVKTQHSELGVGLSVTDPHRDLNAAGVTIALDQVGACGLYLQLQAPLLTAGRLSTLQAARLLVLKLLTCPRIPTLTSGTLVAGRHAHPTHP